MKNQEYILRYTDSISAGENKTITGTAILFDVESRMIYDQSVPYTEIIHKGAITQDLLDSVDCILSYNHQDIESVPLARSNNGKGSLQLRLTEYGVDFSAKMKNTNFSNEVYEAVKVGDLTGVSFRFTVSPKDHKFSRQSDGSYIHDVYRIAGIQDVSIVTVPAYEETSVFARQLNEIKKTDDAELQKVIDEQALKDKEIQDKQHKELEIQRQKEQEFQRYFTELKKRYL